MKKVFLSLSLVLCLVSCIPSNAADEKFNKKKYLKGAEDAMKAGNIFGAADFYEEVLKNSPEDKAVFMPLAQCYLAMRDYESAAKYFNQAYQVDSNYNTIALYYAAICTKMQGKYNDAISMFKRFAKIYKESDNVQKKRWARVDGDGCLFAVKEGKGDAHVIVTHLGYEVNSNYGDMAPALAGNSLYFSSVRSDTVIRDDKNKGKSDEALVKLFTSEVDSEKYSKAERFKKFQPEGKHISNPSFSDDGTKFFYTICEVNFAAPDCEIYISEKKNGEWQEGKKLNDEINLKGFTSTQPRLAHLPNGTDVLYFVSNRTEGGKGGLDIWYSNVNKKGEFTTPRNLGGKINTDRDETTPFFDGKTNTLYFASEGWLGLGGRDIFKSQADANGKYNTNPENLGAPFNSACDDYNFTYGKNSEEGYFVSNRPGIFSVRGKTCCDDIFSYKYDHRIFIAVKGRVFDDATKETITGAAISLSLRSSNLTEGDVVINSDSSRGNIPYFFNLKEEKLYKISAAKTDYFASSQSFSTQGITKSDTLLVDLYLKKLEKNKAYRLNNIYYDFDKWDLRPESKATLDTLYNILIENPTIIIELSSHTDIRGSDEYNKNLSQKRAESCVNYLINEKGITTERITAMGYGKSRTLEDCTKIPECPMTKEGDCPCHEKNRRTEFKVIGELKGELIYEE